MKAPDCRVVVRRRPFGLEFGPEPAASSIAADDTTISLKQLVAKRIHCGTMRPGGSIKIVGAVSRHEEARARRDARAISQMNWRTRKLKNSAAEGTTLNLSNRFNCTSIIRSRQAPPTAAGVGNTRYVRSVYQMICPVLERLCSAEGGDASDGAGTGTEIDEVRGGLCTDYGAAVEPSGGGGGIGHAGADLPALARSL